MANVKPVALIPTRLAQAGLILLDGLLSSYVFIVAFRLRAMNHWPAAAEVFEQLHVAGAISTISADDFRPYLNLLAIWPLLLIVTLHQQALFNLKGEFSLIDDAVRVFKAVSLAALGIVVVAFMYRGGFEFREFSYSRGVFVLAWGGTLVLIAMNRMIVRRVQTALRRRNRNLIRAIIVGDGPLAELCAGEMIARPQLGFHLIGTVARDSSRRVSGLPVLAPFQNLPEVLREFEVEQVFITDATIAADRLFESILEVWHERPVQFSLIPQLLNSLPSKTDIDQIGSLPMIKLFQDPLRGPNRWIKRSADVVISCLVILVFSPLIALLHLLIRLESTGPGIFSQDRIGMDGRAFRAYKFRTMRINLDDRPHRDVMSKTIRGETEPVSGDGLFGKVPHDERVTPIGGWLRRFSLDELPQFYNVLKGEMSIVGPRPPIGYEVEQYSLWQRKRLDVKPGLTGLWQVSGRNRLPFEKMIELDIYYIEHWSLWLDLKIILRTLPAIFRRETA